jgi:hypothetical protein
LSENFFLAGGSQSFFVVLWAFLRGVLEKAGGRTWFFCGKNVVKCVVNVVVKRSYFRGGKYAKKSSEYKKSFYEK